MKQLQFILSSNVSIVYFKTTKQQQNFQLRTKHKWYFIPSKAYYCKINNLKSDISRSSLEIIDSNRMFCNRKTKRSDERVVGHAADGGACDCDCDWFIRVEQSLQFVCEPNVTMTLTVRLSPGLLAADLFIYLWIWMTFWLLTTGSVLIHCKPEGNSL